MTIALLFVAFFVVHGVVMPLGIWLLMKLPDRVLVRWHLFPAHLLERDRDELASPHRRAQS